MWLYLLQIGTSAQAQPIFADPPDWIKTLLGLVIILLMLLFVTWPLWRKRFFAWAFRPFGAPKDGDN